MMEWFVNLESVERRWLLAGTVVAFGLLYYSLIFDPLGTEIERMEKRVFSQWEQLVKLREITRKYGALNELAASTNMAHEKRSLLLIIDSTSADMGVKAAIKRLSPDGESKVRLYLENALFDNLLDWLIHLSEEHRVHIENISLRLSDADGFVNGSLVLSRW